jgi:hypothetical protein
VRVTWSLIWLAARMTVVVLQPILRLPARLRWLQVALVLLFVALFFYRPALAYYWFWGSIFFELARLLGALLLRGPDSWRSWWRG